MIQPVAEWPIADIRYEDAIAGTEQWYSSGCAGFGVRFRKLSLVLLAHEPGANAEVRAKANGCRTLDRASSIHALPLAS
ncbi:hypothetical protein BC938DRAFT_472791 [Jimgerdemannia flammicorona]|uniref:Uncharacterized protein n=1 Tax=Jimgerdemannia flammicorona TaxID=994334 RepID=A0A433Q5C4_9FUNG|nr:hypothetical protein BC938DRAFT_472791 [Jimgerdemannia flammicorona]